MLNCFFSQTFHQTKLSEIVMAQVFDPSVWVVSPSIALLAVLPCDIGNGLIDAVPVNPCSYTKFTMKWKKGYLIIFFVKYPSLRLYFLTDYSKFNPNISFLLWNKVTTLYSRYGCKKTNKQSTKAKNAEIKK